MEKRQLNTLKSLLENPKKIVIIPHRNPDGDAMGSTLALQGFLNKMGHQAKVIAPNHFPHFLNWLPNSEKVIFFDQENEKANQLLQQAEIVFTLDFNSFSRTGKEMQKTLEEINPTFIMIDHHQQPDDYAQFMISKTDTSSTCELVYDFIHLLDKPDLIDQNIATCLYTGAMTDTGSFRFPSTSSDTHRMIAHLIDEGANNAEIHQNIFDTKSPEQLKLLGVALNNLNILEEYKTAYISLSQKELDDHHYKKGDTEGIVNYGLSLEGIIFAVIFIENKEENIIKISFRSKGDFDVNTFARENFNGGGHKNAAGGRSFKSLEGTISDFENLLKNYSEQLKKES